MLNIAIIPRSWAPIIQSIFRIAVGLSFLEHGTGKLLNFPEIPGIAAMMPPALLYFTGAIELVGGVLITLGLLTRPTAFILSGFMAAAYFMAHFPMGFFPALNHGEAALLYCFAFLFLAAAGPGAWAIDKD